MKVSTKVTKSFTLELTERDAELLCEYIANSEYNGMGVGTTQFMYQLRQAIKCNNQPAELGV